MKSALRFFFNILDPTTNQSGRLQIIEACRLVRAENPNQKLAFKAALLLEPVSRFTEVSSMFKPAETFYLQSKETMLPYLAAELQGKPTPQPAPERVAEVIAVLLEEPYGIQEHHVSLTKGKIIDTKYPPKDQHAMMDVEEVRSATFLE